MFPEPVNSLEVKLQLRLIKHHFLKAYGRVEVYFLTFLILELDVDKVRAEVAPTAIGNK